MTRALHHQTTGRYAPRLSTRKSTRFCLYCKTRPRSKLAQTFHLPSLGEPGVAALHVREDARGIGKYANCTQRPTFCQGFGLDEPCELAAIGSVVDDHKSASSQAVWRATQGKPLVVYGQAETTKRNNQAGASKKQVDGCGGERTKASSSNIFRHESKRLTARARAKVRIRSP